MLPEAYWRFRHEFIALDPERYPAIYIDGQVASGNWRCWGDERAALLTEVRTYPSGVREIYVWGAAGDMRAVVDDLRPQAEQWARENGCPAAEIESRPGWAKVLAPHGYQLTQVRLRKEL